MRKAKRQQWRITMLKKFDGNEEALSEYMRQNGNKSRRNQTGVTGFTKMDKEQLRQISRQAGIRSAEIRRQRREDTNVPSENR